MLLSTPESGVPHCANSMLLSLSSFSCLLVFLPPVLSDAASSRPLDLLPQSRLVLASLNRSTRADSDPATQGMDWEVWWSLIAAQLEWIQSTAGD